MFLIKLALRQIKKKLTKGIQMRFLDLTLRSISSTIFQPKNKENRKYMLQWNNLIIKKSSKQTQQKLN